MPVSGETTGKGGACDLAFPGDVPGLLMLKVTAPGYKEAEVLYLPDPAQVIPWLTITLKGALQLEGTVVDGDDQPVADAEVVLDMPAGPRKTKTDAEGRFLLEELMPIRTTVRVEVPGVGSATYRVDLTKKTEPLKIMLRPQRRVSLRVVDADNKPVPDLNLQILAPRQFEAVTDADGQIRVPGVGGNAVQIRVSLADKFYCFDEPEMTFDIDEGSEPVELQVYAAHGGRICGQVVETIEGETQGIPAATVWLVEQGRIGKSVECDEDGKFEMDGVPADSYVIAAGHMTYATSLGKAEVEAGKESTVNFTLGSGAMIRGTVVDPQGKPAERAIVRVAAWYPKREGRSEVGPVELPMRATRTDAEGTVFAGVSAGGAAGDRGGGGGRVAPDGGQRASTGRQRGCGRQTLAAGPPEQAAAVALTQQCCGCRWRR